MIINYQYVDNMIIVPSSDLRNRYSELTDEYLSKGEPIFLTKNGCGHAVLISIDEYERLRRDSMIRKIEEGIRDAKEGKVMSIEESMEAVKKELGL